MAGWHFQFRHYAFQAGFEYYSSGLYKIYRQIQNTICKHNYSINKNTLTVSSGFWCPEQESNLHILANGRF